MNEFEEQIQNIIKYLSEVNRLSNLNFRSFENKKKLEDAIEKNIGPLDKNFFKPISFKKDTTVPSFNFIGKKTFSEIGDKTPVKTLDDLLTDYFEHFENKKKLQETLKKKLEKIKKFSFKKPKDEDGVPFDFYIVKDLSNEKQKLKPPKKYIYHNLYAYLVHSHLIEVFERELGYDKIISFKPCYDLDGQYIKGQKRKDFFEKLFNQLCESGFLNIPKNSNSIAREKTINTFINCFDGVTGLKKDDTKFTWQNKGIQERNVLCVYMIEELIKLKIIEPIKHQKMTEQIFEIKNYSSRRQKYDSKPKLHSQIDIIIDNCLKIKDNEYLDYE